MRRAAPSRRLRAGLAISAGIAVSLALALLAVQALASSTAPPACAWRSVSLVLPASQGTATQSVAFLSVRNAAVRCRLVASASLTVTRNGTRVRSIRGNPVSYRVDETIGHGTTMLFDAWWGNWCATRRGSFRARGVLGTKSGWAGYRYLPVCLGDSSPSRLRGVRSANPAEGPAA
jgi:hypothetical protein